MAYKVTSIKEIAERLKFNKNNNLGTVVLMGAGVSISAGIPSADGIIKVIEENFCTLSSKCKSKTYPEYMSYLTQTERRRIINTLIGQAKLNAAHLYLASIVKNGFIDRILTVNFDPLALKALTLENIFPGIYDFAASQTFIPGEAADISIFHLHGQKDGFVLLNTPDEVERHFEKLKPVFNDTLIKRTLIVVGYSGANDPVFKHLKEINTFEGRLFWIGFEDHEPSKEIEEGVLDGDKYSFYLKGFNADTFFIELSNELSKNGPRIVSRPFEYLEEILDNISNLEMKDKSLNDIVKEPKKWVKTAKAIFQDHDKESAKTILENLENEELIKLARDSWVNKQLENYDLLNISITNTSPDEAKFYFAHFLNDMGGKDSDLAKTKSGTEAEELLYQAIEKYKKAIEYQPSLGYIYFNWGLCLSFLADLKSETEAEELIQQSNSKYQKASELNFSSAGLYYNWGLNLSDLAKLNISKDSKDLLQESNEKYSQAIKIKPDYAEAYINTGINLRIIAKTKTDSEAANLLQESIVKFKKAVELKPDIFNAYINWGLILYDLSKLMKDVVDRERLLNESITKFKKAVELKPDEAGLYFYWGQSLSHLADLKKGTETEDLLHQSIARFKKAVELKPDEADFYYNWSQSLSHLADLKSGTEAEDFLQQSITIYEEALKLKPEEAKIYCNLGNRYLDFAKLKSGQEAETMYLRAISEFQKSIDLHLSCELVYIHIATCMIQIAKQKTEKEAQKLFLEAIDLLEKQEEKKPGYFAYSIACIYSLQNNKEKALEYLIKSKKYKFLEPKEHILNDEDFKNIANEPEFISFLSELGDTEPEEKDPTS